MYGLGRLAAPVVTFVLLLSTSADVAALLAVVLHLPPNLALPAIVILGTALLVRWTWRRWIARQAPGV